MNYLNFQYELTKFSVWKCKYKWLENCYVSFHLSTCFWIFFCSWGFNFNCDVQTDHIFDSLITVRRVDVVLSRFTGLSFTITLRQKLKGVPLLLSLCLVIQSQHARNSFGLKKFLPTIKYVYSSILIIEMGILWEFSDI